MWIRALTLAVALAACSPSAQPGPGDVQVMAPAENASSESPLGVEGVAPNDWYFEATFPIRLETAAGEVLAEAPAIAGSDWMAEGPVPFSAEVPFTVAAETAAILVLEEDMPGEGQEPRQVRIAVTLLPSS
ncbi:MAG: Gmad2 immunoglobulin-like domain-containing protein [Hyphomonadaceae bacterium]